jgi:hypothetical protein|nr:MAG TPA: tail-collar fiber protein [Caudoviricetes sp.]
MAIFNNMSITNKGQALYAKVQAGIELKFTKMMVGSGDIDARNPATLLDLIEPKYTVGIQSMTPNSEAKTALISGTIDNRDMTEAVYICEIGLYAQDPDEGEILYAYGTAGKYGDYYAPASRGPFSWNYQINAAIGNAANISIILSNLTYDYGISNTNTTFLVISGATQKELNKSIDTNLNKINTSLNDLMYETAGGTGTAITLSMQPLKQGYNKTFIASANNNRAATTINGKNLYKPNTTTSPNIISGKAYTVWYNSVSDCFFLQASAEGDVVASEVLAGKKFSNDNDTGLVGAMPNNGALNKVLALNETFNLPPGYYSGGKITQNIPNNGAINASLNCGQSKTLPAGYTSGVTITANSLASQTPSNADASKILSGYYAWINGSQVWGNASIQSLGGKRFASGTFGKFSQYETVMANLEFTPSTIVGYSGSWAYLIKTPDSAVSGLFAIRNGNKSANITIGSNSFSLYNTGASGIIDGVTWYAYE